MQHACKSNRRSPARAVVASCAVLCCAVSCCVMLALLRLRFQPSHLKIMTRAGCCCRVRPAFSVGLVFWSQVQTTIADVLLHSGVATSRYAGRLFRPIQDTEPGEVDTGPGIYKGGYSSTAPQLSTKQGKGAAAAVRTARTGASNAAAVAGPGVKQRIGHFLNPSPVGAWPAAPGQGSTPSDGLQPSVTADNSARAVLAAADAAFEQLAAADIGQGVAGGYDAEVEVEAAFLGGSNSQGLEPLPLVMPEAHTEQE